MNGYEIKHRLSSALSSLRLADRMKTQEGVQSCLQDARRELDEIFAVLFKEWADGELKDHPR